jgi:inner membrane protein
MNIQVWVVWMIFGVIFLIAEIFTAGFFLFWFGIGALAAGLLAFLGVTGIWQLLVFLVLSSFLVAISRKFAQKVTDEQPPGVGADRMTGAEGIVLEEIDTMKNKGRVRIGKEEWRAESKDGKRIDKNIKIKVVQMEGTHVVIVPIQEE